MSESSFTGSASDEMLDGSPVTFDTGVVQRIHSLCRSTYVCIHREIEMKRLENSAIESVDQLGNFCLLWPPKRFACTHVFN